MDRYRKALTGGNGVDDWVATRRSIVETQRYLIGDRTEAKRTVDRTTTSVVVFSDHDGQRGSARLSLEGRSAELTGDAIDRTIFAARLQSNPPFSLPAPGQYRTIELIDSELRDHAADVLAELENRLRRALDGESGIRLSAAELYVQFATTDLISSRGVETSQSSTSLFLELILLGGQAKEEAEFYDSYRARRVADLPIEEIVARQASLARDGAQAKTMPEHDGPIVLTRGCFLPLYEPFRFATSAEIVYRKMSALEVGKSLFADRPIHGDPLTLISDPTVPFGTESSPFDPQGLALAPVTVVDHGVVKALMADQRYSDYLGVSAVGDWTNTRVPAGSTSVDELLDTSHGPVLEIVQFSWLNPDAIRGRFSTEVRLAYLHEPSGTHPVKGGAFAGSVYDLFTNVRFARQTELKEGYFGPSAVRFDGTHISGR